MDESTFNELRGYAQQCDRIMHEVLGATGIEYTRAETIIWDTKSVGVTGDGRAHRYVAELVIRHGERFFWQEEPLRELSTRITNEVKGIGRVTLNILEGEDNYPNNLTIPDPPKE